MPLRSMVHTGCSRKYVATFWRVRFTQFNETDLCNHGYVDACVRGDACAFVGMQVMHHIFVML